MMKKAKSLFVIEIDLKIVISVITALIIFLILLKQFDNVQTQSEKVLNLPVIMYHSIVDDISKSGDYVITPEMLESDLLEIKEKGYYTVSCKELTDYVKGKITLPEKCILITFDDGNYNNYKYAYPLLKKYNMKGVISVVGEFSEQYSKEGAVMNEKYSYLSFEQIKELNESKIFEISNHTYYLHHLDNRRGILKKVNESDKLYSAIIYDDINKLQDKLYEVCGEKPFIFAYPFGAVNKKSENIINSMNFSVTMGCQEGINQILDSKSLYNLKRFNRSNKFNIKKILK